MLGATGDHKNSGHTNSTYQIGEIIQKEENIQPRLPAGSRSVARANRRTSCVKASFRLTSPGTFGSRMTTAVGRALRRISACPWIACE